MSTLAPPTLPTSPRPARDTFVACAVVVAAFLVPAVGFWVWGVRAGVQYSDAAVHHVPTIQQFAAQWPAFDLHAYPAAMTPGYHLLMAAVARAGGSTFALHAATALLTAGLLATLCCAVSAGGRVRPADAVLLCLPFAWSSYVLTSGVYLVPHNLAWWGVLAVLLLALRRPRGGGLGRPAVASATRLLAFAVALLALALVRQIHLWAAAAVVAAAWWDAGDGADGDTPGGGGWLAAPRVWRTAAVAAAALPAVAAVAWFVHKWGGPTPASKAFVAPAAGVNLAAVLLILAVFGAWGPFFLLRLPGGGGGAAGSAAAAARAGASGHRWRWVAVGMAVAAVVAVVQPSTQDPAAGRWSGFWSLTTHFPVIAGRSVLLATLAVVGGGMVGMTLAHLRPRDRWVVGVALAAFTAAHAAVDQSWQRFYDPMVLMVLILAYGPLQPAAPRAPAWAHRFALALLAVAQVGVTYISVHGR